MSEPDAEAPPAVVSIHDVRPDNLDRVAALLERIRPVAGARVALLVVPGLDWTPPRVDQLRRWNDDGLELAGHGWLHRGPPRSLYHRLHSWVISRDQAEHLSRSGEQIEALMGAGRDWFRRQGLPMPTLYVPPAWALGPVGLTGLRHTGYRHIEVLQGFLHLKSGSLLRSPLIGFEADSALRRAALRFLGASAIRRARAGGHPLRISFHPRDMELGLKEEALECLRLGWRFLRPEEAVGELRGRGE